MSGLIKNYRVYSLVLLLLLIIVSCGKKNKGDTFFDLHHSNNLIEDASQALVVFKKDTIILQKELENSIALHDTIRQIAAYRALGDAHAENSHFRSSIEYKRKYLLLAQQIHNDVQEMTALNALGKCYITINISDEALRFYLKALNVGKDLNNDCKSVVREKAKTRLGIGTIYVEFDKTDDANELLDDAMKMATSIIEDNGLMTEIYFWKGVVAQKRQLYDSAYTYYNRALQGAINLNSTVGLSESLLGLGSLSLAQGEYNEAIVSLDNSLGVLQGTSLKLLALKTNIALADAYFNLNDIKKADKHVHDAYALAQELDLSSYLQTANRYLEKIYRAQNNIKLANHHLDLAQKYETKMNEGKINSSLFHIAVEYEKEKNKQLIDEIKMEYNVKARTQKVVIISSTIILLLAITLIVLYAYFLKMRKGKREALVQSAQLKTELYDQISEDIKSPITIISGLTENLKQNLGEGCTTKNSIDLDIIQRETQNISFLINEALVFSNAKNKFSSSWVNGNIVSYLQFLLNCHSDDADVRGVSLIFLHSHENINMNYFKDKLRVAINNILSSAISESANDEKVIMNVRHNVKEHLCTISISHKSKGVSKNDIPDTFKESIDESTQIYSMRHSSKKMILTNQLVKDMGGVFAFQHKENSDTLYNIELPVRNDGRLRKQSDFVVQDPLIKTSESLKTELSKVEGNDLKNKKKGLILIVEDNQFMSFYISSILNKEYNTILAQNGVEALNVIEKDIPDIIITDMMMPLMNGNELTAVVKKTPATSHIPVIMITVKESDENRIQSIKAGVDSFLSKPFVEEELTALVEHLLSSRKGLLKRMGQMLVDKQNRKESNIEDEDFVFIQKISEIIHNEITKSDLSPQMIADKMFISTSHLNRKIKAITDLSTTGYILNLRLNRAKKLLVTTQKQIGEVAMDCGFSDFAYFSRTFKKEFGITPSQYQRMGV